MDQNLGGSAWPKPSDPTTTVDLETFAVDYDFIETMGFRLIEGRSFSPAYADHAKTIWSPFTKLILNKLAVRELGLNEPLELLLNFGYAIGVVDDFYSHSLKNAMRPAVFFLTEQNVNYIVVKISGEDIPGTLAYLGDQWQKVYPEYPFTYQFSDNRIARLYRSDTQFVYMITGLTGIEVFLAAIGLFGLAMFIVNARLKEIGIRKVVGASFWDIVHVLSGEFGLMVCVGAILGLPISYYYMSKWLENFAYHITMTSFPFLSSVGLSLLIIMLTVGYPALLAYTKNPAEMLVSE